jgi:flagellum-specific ATP synthase
LQSVSRLTSRISSPEQLDSARKVREALSVYQQAEDLIQLGAYAAGSNPKLDASIRARASLEEFLRQDAHVACPRSETLAQLNALASTLA